MLFIPDDRPYQSKGAQVTGRTRQSGFGQIGFIFLAPNLPVREIGVFRSDFELPIRKIKTGSEYTTLNRSLLVKKKSQQRPKKVKILKGPNQKKT